MKIAFNSVISYMNEAFKYNKSCVVLSLSTYLVYINIWINIKAVNN